MSLIGNHVFSQQLDWTNVGIWANDFYGVGCSDVTVRDNEVNWTKSSGKKAGWWNGGGCGVIVGEAQNDWDAPIDASIGDRYLPTGVGP